MAQPDPTRLTRYVEMISRSMGGVDALVEHVKEIEAGQQPRPGGLEGMAEPPAATVAREGLETIARGAGLTESMSFGLEAIIDEQLRPVVDVVDGHFTMSHPLWKHMSDDAQVKARVEAVLPSVGRIELPGNTHYPYGGTGFVVGNGLIMTNRHVAEIFATGLGDRSLSFITGAQAGINFVQEISRPPAPTLLVKRIVMIHPYWDVAILAVDGVPASAAPLKLSLKDARALTPGHEIFIVGYPAFDPRNPASVQQDLFRGTFGVKRLQPGQLQGGSDTPSFGKIVTAATHDCSTLGGNSGSAVFDMETGEVMALHFGGSYHDKNFGVPAFALSSDARVVDAGVVFAGTASREPNTWGDWWRQADASEIPSAPDDQSASVSTLQAPPPADGKPNADIVTGRHVVTIEVPLRITISLGEIGGVTKAATAVAAEALAPQATTEALVEPFHEADYTDRTGYNPQFLGEGRDFAVPMPTVSDVSLLASTKSGEDTLRYQNFSIQMNAARRLAAVCASNVTREAMLRRPDPSKGYTRKDLSDLGPNDQERWFLDPRLDDRFQLPDVFFTKDGGAFDKGHIVRREDAAWGRSYSEIRRANGDTFHVTNCSPQVAGFNRSASGKDNWGDLENAVYSGAASERLCVLAGPVLDPSDEVFVGTAGARVTLRAKIPTRFWKVVVARTEAGIAAFGFILEQDLGDVPLEFAVPAEFKPKMISLPALAAKTGVVFAKEILDADQFDTGAGEEISARSGAPRKKNGT